ncbi:MAG: DUF4384 domain-containing protein [Polaromonas sp.]|uniref:DUF4384 domain-containing protein n=1 Tax=Polaromonas sp. TaxID=1869339 RepID=UPI00248A7AF3|nr:DUF4384 domain-containing protein [Polaromonas sp.]MDI1268309.1 DUF4384 domain-containing protein [Polaromonas sp.]
MKPSIRLEPVRSRLSSLALVLGLAGAVLLAGCATPADPRDDAKFQSYASATNRPVVRPVRSVSSFSDSLMCMDYLFREAEISTTLITSKQIPDFSTRVPVATKDMIITALSQMSRLSNAFRYVDYEVDIARQDTVQNLTTILLNNNQIQLQRPALYFSGAIAFVDQNVINNRFEVGTAASRLDTGYSKNRNATIIGLELHIGDFRSRTLIPGLDSANEVIIASGGQGLDLAGRIGNYGVQFNVGRDYAQGAGAAIRTLVELATIELVGKWARVPYWQCLTLEQTHPDFQRQLRDWYDQGSPLQHNKLVQRSLISHGYLGGNGTQLDEHSPEFRTALGRFQADTGMVVSGVVDFPTYERALRHFVSLGKDGKLVQIGWSPTSASPLANAADYQRPGGTSPYGPSAYGSAAPPRKISLQIENVLVGRSAFEVGEQIFLSASLSRASYLYCFLHEAGGKVMRLLPNATNPNALLSANQAIRIPDWMSPTPGFIMDSTSAGTERAGCFATDADVAGKLPQYLQAPALVPLRQTTSLEDINKAFASSLGADGYTFAGVQWQVGPKRAAAPAAAAAPPAAAR